MSHYLPEIEITPHAIDRASLRCMGMFFLEGGDLGLHAWLLWRSKRAIQETRPKQIRENGIKIYWQYGMKFYFQKLTPGRVTLLTVAAKGTP